MSIHDQLFQGTKICLAPIDLDKDPEIIARWTQNAEYQRMLNSDRVHPLAPAQVKKQLEAIEKEAEESNNQIYYAVRTLVLAEQPERLIGFARLYWIEWSHGAGMIQLGIGEPTDRCQGYGSEVLRLMLYYAFMELNMFRLGALIPEYNTPALALFQKAGFSVEVRRREALYHYGQRWDLLQLGLLQDDWKAYRPDAA
jgi:RimJ/RimL family protein N-acetyltransferase